MSSRVPKPKPKREALANASEARLDPSAASRRRSGNRKSSPAPAEAPAGRDLDDREVGRRQMELQSVFKLWDLKSAEFLEAAALRDRGEIPSLHEHTNNSPPDISHSEPSEI